MNDGAKEVGWLVEGGVLEEGASSEGSDETLTQPGKRNRWPGEDTSGRQKLGSLPECLAVKRTTSDDPTRGMSHGSGDGHDCQPFSIYRWWPGIAGRPQLVRGAHRTTARGIGMDDPTMGDVCVEEGGHWLH